MKPVHYFLIALIVIIIASAMVVKGCFNCTGKALSPAPANTVYVPSNQ